MDRRARARPFAASKLAAVVVAIVAFGTADAATYQGSVAGGVQYTTTGTDTSIEEALSVTPSPASTGLTSPRATTPPTSLVTLTGFTILRGTCFLPIMAAPDAVVKDYIDGALVSPDFKTENP